MNDSTARVLAGARIFDLSHVLEQQMPVSHNHPGFRMALMRRHGDAIRPDGGSAANELIVMGGHSGTHFDALAHVSHHGKLYGGVDAMENQAGGRMKRLGLDDVDPIVCRGVLLDIAGAWGRDVLGAGEAISSRDLEKVAAEQRVEVREGDAVLIRTGWEVYWKDPDSFLGQTKGVPGPDVSAAEWLAARKIKVTGSDTVAYEHIRPGKGHVTLPVHRLMLVEAGIHIIEAMSLRSLAENGIREFLFIVAPLRIAGATGVPVRPLAVVE